MGNNNNNINIIIFIVLLLLIVYCILRYAYFIKHEHFVCPKCGYEFKPNVWRLIVTQNAVDGKIMKCPGCKKRVFLPPVKDKKK